MEMKLAENIRALRKERRLTQEQFAEVLGVTAGAVYKWESGMSIPELGLIVEMADFFDTTVDVLLGYKTKDNRLASVVRRLEGYCRMRDPEAMIEAEKALKKYPNSFELVYVAADVYLIFGVEGRDREKLFRVLELLEHARLLITQNNNPEISDLTLRGKEAMAYFLLGELDKSVELMKKHNVEGIFNDSIGAALAIFSERSEEAENYLSKALLQSTGTMISAVSGFAFVFCSRRDWASAEAILEWGITLLLGLKKGESAGFADKTHAVLLALLAHVKSAAGKADEANAYLQRSAEIARDFDAAPDYGAESIRYISFTSNTTVYDLLGATAAESVSNMLGYAGDAELGALWKEMTEHA
ncbi:MAG: helix-turn-helix domain-containing protein [Oscillospiraceae bacterium]|nr:helix-turn-helix domain-containing protein [Oscillospiraceae bacterium]